MILRHGVSNSKQRFQEVDMTTIESKKVDVNAPVQEVFEYLGDMNNFKDLLPMDRISNWESDTDYCSFKVQGTYTIRLDMNGAEAPNKIFLKSGEGSPFAFDLNIHLNEAGEATNAYQVCEADLNPFIKMMVEKPLRNLFDYIADQLKAKFQS